jgi:quercetin dioxygenase-like cupin family protein
MTPVQRSLNGDALAFDLVEEMGLVREELAGGRERIARTLVKDGPLRLTLVGLSAGGAIHEHEAAGPITVHVLDGEVELSAAGETRSYRAGAIIAVDQRVRHSVRSTPGGLFLLTLASPPPNSKPR